MLNKIIVYHYVIHLETGLHIGGGKDNFDIGGADSTVAKDPLTSLPYIPGSSIKGKLRTLLTWKYEKIIGDRLTANQSDIKALFGTVSGYSNMGISRLLFRDAFLCEETKENIQKMMGKNIYTEIKAENSVDPLRGKANSPRWIERVPANTKFNAEIVLNLYDGDQEETLCGLLEESIQLLEMNYLGGSGSRGYGKVKMELIQREVKYV